MILIRAPLRVSFGGGGTDLPAYYEQHGGLVVSAAIARYSYTLVEETSDGVGRMTSADYDLGFTWTPKRLPPLRRPLLLAKAALRECAERGALNRAVALSTASDAPPGSGLGSSSAMAIALLQALSVTYEAPLSRADVAARACALEIERLDMPIGKQDQYASAHGGINAIEFAREGVRVTPLRVSASTRAALDQWLLLFWTGRSRDSASILRSQRHDTRTRPEVVARLDTLKRFAEEMRVALEEGDLWAFGRLLDAAWQTKRRLSDGISSDAIDDWYAAAKRAGALGGKITGAGGGGFLLLFAPPERQRAVRVAMARRGLSETPFTFDMEGVTRVEQLPQDWNQRFVDKRADSGSIRVPWSA